MSSLNFDVLCNIFKFYRIPLQNLKNFAMVSKDFLNVYKYNQKIYKVYSNIFILQMYPNNPTKFSFCKLTNFTKKGDPRFLLLYPNITRMYRNCETNELEVFRCKDECSNCTFEIEFQQPQKVQVKEKTFIFKNFTQVPIKRFKSREDMILCYVGTRGKLRRVTITRFNENNTVRYKDPLETTKKIQVILKPKVSLNILKKIALHAKKIP
jgi:hypothetical protein